MKKSAEIRQELNGLVSSQTEIMTKAGAEKRALTPEEGTAFDALQTQIDEKRAELARVEKHEESVRSMGATSGVSQVKPEERELDQMKDAYSLHKVIRSLNGTEKLSGVELELHQETVKRSVGSGIAFSGVAVPLDLNKRAAEKRAAGQTVSEDSGAFGGNLVQTDVQNPIEYLRPQPIVESLGARMITGLTGNLKFPTNDGGIVATWEGEVDTVTNTKTAYGSKEMTPKRLAASVLISLQNLMQTSGSLELMTAQDIRDAVAQAIDAAAINGPGTGGAPLGVLNTSGVNSVVAGTNGTLPTWAQVVALETGVFVGNANAARMAYLVNPVTKGRLKIAKHEAGDANYLMQPDGTMNGYQVGVTNLVPSNLTKGSATAVCSAGIFGDFSQLIIGQWAFMDLSVDNVSQKKSGYIELTANTFLDLLVRQPKAFSVIKDWLTA